MQYGLRVSRDGALIFETVISELYARSIALMAAVIPGHIAKCPEHAPPLMGRISLTIEDAIQEDNSNLALWKELCACQIRTTPIDIELTGLFGASGQSLPGSGGGGGAGAWPGGGGGGGGAGISISGAGAAGAGGALAVICWSYDARFVDIEVFVTPGEFSWIKPQGIDFVHVIGIGGGGGGGSGATQ